MNTLLGRISALSSKARVFLAIFVVFVSILSMFLLWRLSLDSKKGNDFSAEETGHARAAQIAALTRDQDADGLKDWEEAIFRTDQKNPDTDADGTADGEEIKQNRDPLIPGPDDHIATSTPQIVDYEDAPPGTVNLTGRLAQSLGQQLITQRLINPEKNLNPTAIAEQIAEGATTYVPTAPSLTIKDIIITKDESPTAITAWARQFDSAIQNSFRDKERDEVSLMLLAMRSGDDTTLATIDRYIPAYDVAITRIKEIPVPAPFASEQLRFLNLLVRFREIARRLRAAADDPVAAIASVKPYFTLTDQLGILHQDISRKLVDRSIVF